MNDKRKRNVTEDIKQTKLDWVLLLLANLIIIRWAKYSKAPLATLSMKNISNASIFWMTEVNILYIFNIAFMFRTEVEKASLLL